MDVKEFDALKLELSRKAKNGLDFIMAAAIVWSAITYVWTLHGSSYKLSVLTFIVGGFMLPLAGGFSKLLKTQWKVQSNPLQPLGLVLNFAQLFYFPFLVFVLLKSPDYFVMTYGIITGAHFFPYSWYYKEPGYAVMAGLISIGSLVLALNLPVERIFIVPAFVAGSLIILGLWLWLSYKARQA